MTSRRDLLSFLALSLILGISYSFIVLCPAETAAGLAKEDGIIETLSAAFLLAASLVFFLLFMKSRSGNAVRFPRTRRNAFFFILALMFFFGFGEELSWGSRLYGLHVLEGLRKLNGLNEINVHNLPLFSREVHGVPNRSLWSFVLNFDRLYSLFWFIWGLVIPVLNKVSEKFSRWLEKIDFPVVPLWIGPVFLVNYVFSKIMESWTFTGNRASLETKECVSVFLFLLIGVVFLWSAQRKGPFREAVSSE